MRKLVKLIPAMMLIFILAACGTTANSNTTNASAGCPAARAKLKFYVITHGQASDPFWSVVKKGVDQAAHDMCVTAIYESPASSTFDVVAMAHLIDTAVAARPDGLVRSVPDPKGLSPSVKPGVATRIPVLSINSRSGVAESVGGVVHL